MVVTMITETYWPEVNGVAMTLHRLLTGLAGLGHDIQLVCPAHKDRNAGELPANVLYKPIKGYPVPGYSEANFGLPCPRVLKRLWKAVRPDVIYVATEGPLGWSAITEAGRMGIPVVSGFHTNFHSYSRHYRIGFLEPIIERYLVAIHNRTRMTVVPTYEQKSMLETMGVNNVAVMGRGVDTMLYSPSRRNPSLRAQWGAAKTDPVMIYVGRIAEEKNLALTINAYHALYALNNKLKFVLVGDGPLAAKLKKDYPQFIMTGTRTGEELAEHYASADLFVFTSLTETFGNVILEAMASGLGVVAYDYAAARMHIKDGENGLLAAFGNADNFLYKARRLVRNDVLLKKLRIHSEKEALQHSWDAIVGQFENILAAQTDIYQSGWKSDYKAKEQSNQA